MKLVPDASAAPDIDALLVAMRPRLHRYCARMVGSVIDGEDVLQDALIKAVESLGSADPIGNPEGWLFRMRTTPRWTFCAAAAGGKRSSRLRRWT
jgi:RNA polymerase sigma-70 factor (ECF subfamily)